MAPCCASRIPVRGRGEIGRRCRLKIGFHRSAGSSPAVRTILLAIALTGCDHRPDTGPVVVSAIGGSPALVDTTRGRPDIAQKLMVDSLAQGLVRFDAAGQIEQGLAERWIVIDGGLTYIFRLRDGEWQDGPPVTADDVVAILKRQIAHGSRNPLAPFLTAIDDIVVMTPQVIEVRLKRPRPDLLKLFAQPELALVRLNPPGGSGPFRIAVGGRSPLLRPAFDPDRADPDDRRKITPEADVRLIGERASRAIARFAAPMIRIWSPAARSLTGRSSSRRRWPRPTYRSTLRPGCSGSRSRIAMGSLPTRSTARPSRRRSIVPP